MRAGDDYVKNCVAFAWVFISPGEISFKTGAPSKGRYVSARHEIPPTLDHCEDDEGDEDDDDGN